MINIQDYKAYMKGNYNFIELLRENNSLVYDRIRDLIKVLGYIEFQYDQNKPIDEELKVIFEVGFSFFHEQLEEIKIYYNTYFKRDLSKFLQHELLINYALYLSDLIEVLKEKNMYKEEIRVAFGEILEDIEKTLRGEKKETIKAFNRYNEIIETFVPVGTLTTLEVFAMIVEELQI